MTGQIPPYGKKGFRQEQLPGYVPGWSHTVYVLKADPDWFIRSDSTSERWHIFRTGSPLDQPIAVKDTLGEAMDLMLDAIDYGYYQTRIALHQALTTRAQALDTRRMLPTGTSAWAFQEAEAASMKHD